MTSLVIEGDPGAINRLLEELLSRGYLMSDLYHRVFSWDLLTVGQEIEAAIQKADDDV